MRHHATRLTLLLSFAMLTMGATTGLAQVEEDDASNGIVFMVHGHFEPNPVADAPPPPAQEAFAATANEGEIVLYVIPYSVETGAPVAFEDTTVAVEGPLPGQTLVLEPRAGTEDDQRCIDETTISGHEGDISDCLVVTFDAETVRGWGAVDIELRGFDTSSEAFVQETYSSPAHVAIHATMEDGQPGFGTADQLSAASTPFLVEDLVDPAS